MWIGGQVIGESKNKRINLLICIWMTAWCPVDLRHIYPCKYRLWVSEYIAWYSESVFTYTMVHVYPGACLCWKQTNDSRTSFWLPSTWLVDLAYEAINMRFPVIVIGWYDTRPIIHDSQSFRLDSGKRTSTIGNIKPFDWLPIIGQYYFQITAFHWWNPIEGH